MAIEFGCPVCSGTLRVEDDAVGQVVRCGGCLTMLRVPNDAPSPPSFPGSAASPFPGPPDEPLSDAPPRRRSPSEKSKSPEEPRPSDDRFREKPRPPRRRRVRREPPPPTGGSPVFWAMIVVCMVGFGSCIMCCGLIPIMSEAKWQTYNSIQGGFQVDLPSKLRNNMSIRGLNKTLKFKIEGTHLALQNQDYSILYKDIASAERRRGNGSEAIDEAVKEFEAAGFVKHGQAKESEMYGYPGVELQFRSMQGGSYITRIIVVDTRLYVLLAGGQMGYPEEENIKRFFGSFSVTDEKLIKGDERGRVAALGMFLMENSFKTIAKERQQAED